MTDSLKTYAAARDALLSRIAETLTRDERFLAAWLAGSFGRGEADDVSDLDLSVVVSDTASDSLCARPWQVSGRTTRERGELISQFGQPALIHENHHNAPSGGTFTFVLYAESALMVDWVLIPQSQAWRPAQSVLLFDKAGVPVLPLDAPESERERGEKASEHAVFFWMMSAVTAKYILRRDIMTVLGFLETLHELAHEVERLTQGRAFKYQRGSLAPLALTQVEQIRALRQLGEKMTQLIPEIEKLGVDMPLPPALSTIERLLASAHPGQITPRDI